MVEGFDELPGVSVFYKDADGDIFHTYSSYARGGEEVIGAFISSTSRRRAATRTEMLDWVRRHDEYEPAAASAGSGER